MAGNGIQKLKNAGIKVIMGVLEKECRQLNKRFITFHEQGRPYVILKWAQSADGFMGKVGERTQISSPFTKQLVHKMRAENMAILVGSGTAINDNPRLLNTHWVGRNPIRVLLDRQGRVPKNYRIFSPDAPTLVLTGDTRWESVLEQLAMKSIHSVLVEGGAMVLNHILQTGLYDEIHIEVNPAMFLREGVKAPCVVLPSTVPQEADGNLLYTLYNDKFQYDTRQAF